MIDKKPEYISSPAGVVNMGVRFLKCASGGRDFFNFARACFLYLIERVSPQAFREKVNRRRNRVQSLLFREKCIELLNIADENAKFGRIKDIYLPIDANIDWLIYMCLIYDTFGAYLYNENQYDEKFYDKWDKTAIDNVSQLEDGHFNCTVRPDDVVLDLGAFFGDFAVLAAKTGAGQVFAFEPAPKLIGLIHETARKNNADIKIVPYGVSDRREELPFIYRDSGSRFSEAEGAETGEKIQCVCLDEWCAENNVRPDFIKADIEGFERRMLAGARSILKTAAPKLAICTYHLPDDPEVIRDLILDTNPNYVIVQKRRQLYAAVPNNIPDDCVQLPLCTAAPPVMPDGAVKPC